ncbi:hypothetical protein Aduo_010610 [Ancylostoma duodenale]
MVKAKNGRSNPGFMNNDERGIQMKNVKFLTGSPPHQRQFGRAQSDYSQATEVTQHDACSDVSDKLSLGNDVKSNEGNVLQEIVAGCHQRKDVLNADAAILRDHLYDCPNTTASLRRIGHHLTVLASRVFSGNIQRRTKRFSYLGDDCHISDEYCETWMTITARTRLFKFRSELRSHLNHARAPKASCRGNMLI